MEGTGWGTEGRREEERDHLGNSGLLMQDTWQFVQCLVSPVLAKFHGFHVSLRFHGFHVSPWVSYTASNKASAPWLLLQSEEHLGTPSDLSSLKSTYMVPPDLMGSKLGFRVAVKCMIWLELDQIPGRRPSFKP